MKRLLAIALAAAGLAACGRMPGDPPPRDFMQGGAFLPAATGYWLHQYAESDEIENWLQELGFTCTEAASSEGRRLRCERGFRIPGGVLSRRDFAEIAFRRNGAIASAESGCRFALFDSDSLSGTCTAYAAKGAVYPSVESFATMAEAMLRPMSLRQPVSMYRLVPGAPAPLRDAEAAADQLGRWRFECGTPKHQYKSGFRGNAGETLELTCQQWSLRTPSSGPQSQQVIVRYDSADLAVLDVSVRLDGAAMALSPTLRTPREASARGVERDRAPGPPTSLTLTTLAGERFEMPWSAVGTGSRQQTRDGFTALTPESQRALVQAYLDKQSRQWVGKIDRLSYAHVGALEWYGPEALPHLDALASDERPELTAAILKYRCLEANLQMGSSVDETARARTMAACIDERRAALPQSIAAMDRLLAGDLAAAGTMDARALGAFHDFRRDVLYVYALGPDGKKSAVALDAAVEGKDGLDPALASLVQAALVQRDRPLPSR